jgi:hypothetical protein
MHERFSTYKLDKVARPTKSPCSIDVIEFEKINLNKNKRLKKEYELGHGDAQFSQTGQVCKAPVLNGGDSIRLKPATNGCVNRLFHAQMLKNAQAR